MNRGRKKHGVHVTPLECVVFTAAVLVIIGERRTLGVLAFFVVLCWILYKHGGEIYGAVKKRIRILDGNTVSGANTLDTYSEKKIREGAAHIKTMDGFEYESYVAERMKKNGFTKVTVTSKSGDFGADITAVDAGGKKICIQCKKYSHPVGVKAVQEVYAAKVHYGCSRAAVVTTSTFTEAAEKLAKETSVRLIEKDMVCKL